MLNSWKGHDHTNYIHIELFCDKPVVNWLAFRIFLQAKIVPNKRFCPKLGN